MALFTSVLFVVFLTLKAMASDSFPNSDCPPEWDITVRQELKEVAIRVHGNLLESDNSRVLGNEFWVLSNGYRQQSEFQGDQLIGFFKEAHGETVKWPIGEVVEVDVNTMTNGPSSDQTVSCLKLKQNPDVRFLEIEKRVRATCSPLPSWLCPFASKIQVSLRILAKVPRHQTEASLDSLTSAAASSH